MACLTRRAQPAAAIVPFACCSVEAGALAGMALSAWSGSDLAGLPQEAVRLRPAYADAFTGMGVALKELKRRDEAEACFSQVVRLRPGCALSLGNLAGARAGRGMRFRRVAVPPAACLPTLLGLSARRHKQTRD